MKMKDTIRNILKEEFKQISQPTGHSCGPTCLKMVHDFYVGDIYKIEDICRECGTDWTVGTPPDRMIKGLDWMGINYIHHKDIDNPYDFLRDVFERGHVAILRTMTHGVPHYIVARGWEDGEFIINDPWLGPIRYTEEQLEGIWHSITGERHESFEISGGNPMPAKKKTLEGIGEITIEGYNNKEEVIEALKLAIPVFSKQMGPEQLVGYLMAAVDWRLSVKAVADGKIVGFYFFDEQSLVPYLSKYCEKDENCDDVTDLEKMYPSKVHLNVEDYVGKRGLEGVGLGVDPEYKGLGIGKKLIEYSQNMGYDYIWGMQLASLGNLEHWLKRRKLAVELPGMYVTVEDLN